MFLHDCSRSYFLCASAVATGLFRAFLDVLILSLFLASNSSKMLLTRHECAPSPALLMSVVKAGLDFSEDLAGNGQDRVIR